MANRHFAKLADVWKHLVLTEVLTVDRPDTLFDTHAGHATYPLTDDPERRYGVLGFLEAAADCDVLGRSAYTALLLRHRAHSVGAIEYPAGPMLAMLALGDSCRYVFCDLDPESCANIRGAAAGLGLDSFARVVDGDGMATVHRELQRGNGERALVYTDPFDHRAVGTARVSALDVAQEAARGGVGVVYWYGYDRADRRGWIFDVLAGTAPDVDWWCGDVMVTAPGADMTDGDLGAATSPGTGFGLVCANVSATATERCAELGGALRNAYAGRALPDGRIGDLDFTLLA